jgi:tetratricopeptide (TPR) repeat protein
MRRSVALHAALAALFLAIYSGQSGVAAQTSQGRISGVVNDENSRAIKAATVTAENSDTNQTFTATTDDKGRFTILGLRPGTWRFTAQAPGYFADQGSMPIHVGAPNPPIAFALKKTGLPGGGALGSITAKDLQSELATADALFNESKWDEAVTAYKAIMEKAPTLTVIDLQIAAAYINKKDYDAAIVAYAELLKIDPNNDKATVGIARADLEKGDPAAAESRLAKAAENPSAGREIFYNLGEILFDKGDTDGSMTWYRRAAEADPSWGKPLYKLGLAAQKKGDTAGASQFLNKVLAVDPASPEAAMAKSSLDQLNR